VSLKLSPTWRSRCGPTPGAEAHTAAAPIQVSSQGIAAEIETLGPATTQQLTVTLANGGYFWRCLTDGAPTTNSATVQASGSRRGPAP
jgi:high-affinity iron transporter